MQKHFMSTEEVANYLCVEYQLVYKLIKSGELPALKLGRVFKVRKSDLDIYIDRNTTGNKLTVCSVCNNSYASKQMLKYKCAERECLNLICVDCHERNDVFFCKEHNELENKN